MLKKLAIKMLARREHSKLELKHKLMAKGFATEDIEKVLQELIKEGLQSDERFAEMYVRTRISHGFGPIRIAHELAEYGIVPEIIQRNVFASANNWYEIALAVLQKKFGKRHIKKDFTVLYSQQSGFPASKRGESARNVCVIHEDANDDANKGGNLSAKSIIKQKRFLQYKGFDFDIIKQIFIKN